MVTAVPEYEAWLTRAGLVRIRQSRPDDRAAVRAMHRDLSLASIYLRYFSAGVNIERTLESLLRPPDDTHGTLVAIIDDHIVAVACYECLDDASAAEIAFLVDDTHHGIGLATLLLAELTLLARSRGIRRFVAVTLPSNTAMMRVFRDCGLRCSVTHGADGIQIDVPLGDDPRPAHGWGGLASTVLYPPLERVRVGRS
jgi:GNAT superfamily N-acetyltransferase